jgi:malonyl CoA-acyl carrier protein transacylase
VRWLEVMRALDARGVTHFVETGPGHVLTNLVRKSLAGAMEAAGA